MERIEFEQLRGGDLTMASSRIQNKAARYLEVRTILSWLEDNQALAPVYKLFRSITLKYLDGLREGYKGIPGSAQHIDIEIRQKLSVFSENLKLVNKIVIDDIISENQKQVFASPHSSRCETASSTTTQYTNAIDSHLNLRLPTETATTNHQRHKSSTTAISDSLRLSLDSSSLRQASLSPSRQLQTPTTSHLTREILPPDNHTTTTTLSNPNPTSSASANLLQIARQRINSPNNHRKTPFSPENVSKSHHEPSKMTPKREDIINKVTQFRNSLHTNKPKSNIDRTKLHHMRAKINKKVVGFQAMGENNGLFLGLDDGKSSSSSSLVMVKKKVASRSFNYGDSGSPRVLMKGRALRNGGDGGVGGFSPRRKECANNLYSSRLNSSRASTSVGSSAVTPPRHSGLGIK